MLSFQDKIKDVYKQAKAGNWNYPQMFNGLKTIGVQSYTMNVLKYTIEYVGGDETFLEIGPSGWKVDLGMFNEAQVIKAVRRSQRKEIDYPTFLKEIAAAGVPKYYVSMSECTVSYLGADEGNKYVEKVPTTGFRKEEKK